MTDFAQLGISVDSSSAKQATTDLLGMADAAYQAEKATQDLADTQQKESAQSSQAATVHRDYAAVIAQGSAASSALERNQTALANATANATASIAAGAVPVTDLSKQLLDATSSADLFKNALASIRAPEVGTIKANIAEIQAAMNQAAIQSAPAPSVLRSNRTGSTINDEHAVIGKVASEYNALDEAQKRVVVSAKNAATAESASNALYYKAVEDLNRYRDGLGKTYEQKILLRAQEDGLNVAQLTNIKGITDEIAARRAAIAATQQHGKAIEGMGNLTAGAAREFIVLGREVITGNFSRIPGSLLVLANRSGNLGAIMATAFSATGAAIAATVVTVGAFAAAIIESSHDADEFTRAIAVSGDAAGVTRDQLSDMATAIGKNVGTAHAAAAALAELVVSGKVARESLQAFATTTIKAEKDLGISTKEMVQIFAEIAKDPVAAAQKLNDAYHFLNAATYDRIKALQEQGHAEQAAAIEQQAFVDAIDGRIKDVEGNLSGLGEATRSVARLFGDMWNAIYNGAKPETLGDQIKGLKGRLAALANGGITPDIADAQKQFPGLQIAPAFNKSQLDAQRVEIQNKLSDLIRLQRQQGDAADSKSVAAKTAQDYIEAGKELDRYRTKEEQWAVKRSQLLSDFEKQAKGAASEGASPLSEAKKQQILDDAKQQIFGKGAKAPDTTRASLANDLEAIKAAAQQQIDIYAGSEKILEANRHAGLVHDSDYYEAKREFITAETKIEIEALNQENARLAQQAKNGVDRLQRDKQISANRRQIAKLELEESSKTSVIDTQEAASKQKIADGYDKATLAAKKYVEQLAAQHNKSFAGIGLSGNEKQQVESAQSIIDRIQQMREAASDKFKSLTIVEQEDQQSAYDNELKQLDDYLQKALDENNDYFKRLNLSQQDWTVGAAQAFANLGEEVNNVAKSTEVSFSKAFNSMADTLANFITTGKIDFKSLGDSIVSDILRMIIKWQLWEAIHSSSGQGVIGSVLGAIGGEAAQTSAANAIGGDVLGNFIGLAGLASGGPADAGSLHRVVENGPELLSVAGNTYLMMGTQGGQVTPLNGTASPVMTQIVNFYNNGPIDKRTQTQLASSAYNAGRMANARNG